MPPIAGQDRLYGIARATLDVVAAGLDAAGQSAPERQYVADGNLVAWDCEQLVVTCESTQGHDGNIAVESSVLMGARAATLGIWLLRCCPTSGDDGEPPSAAEIDASAAMVLADPTIITRSLYDAHQAGNLATCRGLVFQRWNAMGPMGGLTGGVYRVLVNLTEV